ncbi:MAG: CreA family protein [Desulfobulbaceae bacterium]|jgi:CreA protein|nr:CreA family protein [Desulfobulbaceae bacterium]
MSLCVKVSCSLLLLSFVAAGAQAEEIGSARTTFKFLGANDRVVVEAFDDPDIPGATCYLSRAKTGGISGSMGIAEDTSDASLVCLQTGPIKLSDDIRSGKTDGERVFRKASSILFKTINVVRFYDKKRDTLVYLTYSNKIIEGSPKNSVAAIRIQN